MLVWIKLQISKTHTKDETYFPHDYLHALVNYSDFYGGQVEEFSCQCRRKRISTVLLQAEIFCYVGSVSRSCFKVLSVTNCTGGTPGGVSEEPVT